MRKSLDVVLSTIITLGGLLLGALGSALIDKFSLWLVCQLLG